MGAPRDGTFNNITIGALRHSTTMGGARPRRVQNKAGYTANKGRGRGLFHGSYNILIT